MNVTIHDWIGALAALLIVGSYLLLQLDRLDQKRIPYSAANAVGAALIIESLVFDFNLSALLVESFWLAVSLYGVGRALTLRHGAQQNDPQDGLD